LPGLESPHIVPPGPAPARCRRATPQRGAASRCPGVRICPRQREPL